MGRNESRSATRKVEVYSVSDEAVVLDHDLMSLPGREGYLVLSGPRGTTFSRMRTIDMPTRFHTAIGTLDGLADLIRLTAAPSLPAEPTREIFERLREQDRPASARAAETQRRTCTASPSPASEPGEHAQGHRDAARAWLDDPR